MKNLILIAFFSLSFVGFSQDQKPTYKVEGDLIKATYYYEDGSIKTEGFFKDKKITGEWTRFDKKGNKTQTAFYQKGKKVGKWFIWNKDELKEINYDNNIVVSMNNWKTDSKVAYNR
ncbi:nicotinic acid mononucleotide adenyltransferase [uncultured Polaribacter sp.]|uniref:toxin-antitoxin system YwqK family antitoxin n=1 Tax=uncultured Polaribacter sp. TaxID=174711 RepID=UPI002623C40A|nr:nicotinic acid mononucleotide adenyltransferase [uncultured Polaribacter sp.]